MTKPELPTSDSSSSRYLVYVVSIVLAAGVMFTLLRMLLPLLQVVIPIAIVGWFWRRWQTNQQQQQTSLDAIFYQLLQEHQGQVTVLDFAMTAKLSASAAKAYLDARARDFSAQFEVTDRGDVYYLFPTLKSSKFQATVLPNKLQTTARPTGETELVTLPLTQTQLARRLQVSTAAISRRKQSPELLEWSKVHDPDGIAWAYHAETRRFLPLPESSN